MAINIARRPRQSIRQTDRSTVRRVSPRAGDVILKWATRPPVAHDRPWYRISARSDVGCIDLRSAELSGGPHVMTASDEFVGSRRRRSSGAGPRDHPTVVQPAGIVDVSPVQHQRLLGLYSYPQQKFLHLRHPLLQNIKSTLPLYRLRLVTNTAGPVAKRDDL